ncbi:MAG TPA: J domain-containing protein [Myxococcota bacterium]
MAEPAKRDLYQILGVARDANEDVIRKAYRKLARRHHPDVNPNDKTAEDKFKEISHAYSVLSDTEKRRTYDEFGDVSLEGGFDPEAARRAREAFGARFGGGGARPGFGDAEGFAFEGLDGLFSDLFSRQGRGRGRGADVEAELELDFLDAARGAEQRLTLARPQPDGSLRQETVTVRIPPGVADGGRLRIPGKGGPGAGGGPPGDLHARIRVRPHRFFRRDGRDLLLDVEVSVREAALGAKVEVPTLEGRVTLSIPPGTDGGTKLRVRGKGIPSPSGGAPGDLYAIVQIRVPRDLGPRERELLDELAAHDPPDLRKELL